jgi:hypothetical protein
MRDGRGQKHGLRPTMRALLTVRMRGLFALAALRGIADHSAAIALRRTRLGESGRQQHLRQYHEAQEHRP